MANHNSEVEWIEFNYPIGYSDSLEYMEKIVSEILEKKTSEKIILTQHKPVITAGTGSHISDIINHSNIPIIQTGRGGKHTFHGPGQRIIYPIINLSQPRWNKDLKKYLNFLHQWIIRTLSKIGIIAYQKKEHIGVWVNKNGLDAKIAAIGIRARKWVVFHGAAVNITTDLDNFQSFIPCGIRELGVTSILDMGVNISLEEFDEILKKEYYNYFKYREKE